MEWEQLEAVQSRVGSQARIVSDQVVYKLVLGELCLVAETGIAVPPRLPADLVGQILDSGFRCGWRTQQTFTAGVCDCGGNRPESSYHHQRHGRDSDESSEKASLVHDTILPATKSDGASDWSSFCSRISPGIRTSRIARILLPKGRIPHKMPCQRGGICGALRGVAGGPPSLLHIMTVLFSRSSTGRQPANFSSGS